MAKLTEYIEIGISIDFSESNKNVKSAEARIGKSQRPISECVTGKTLQQAFEPHM